VVSQPDSKTGRDQGPADAVRPRGGASASGAAPSPSNREFEQQTCANCGPDLIARRRFRSPSAQDILDLPRYGCINVHACSCRSIAAPRRSQWAIINGDRSPALRSCRWMKDGYRQYHAQQQVPILDDDHAQASATC